MNIFILTGPTGLDSLFYSFFEQLALVNNRIFRDVSALQAAGYNSIDLLLKAYGTGVTFYGGLRYLDQDFFASSMQLYDLSIVLLDLNSLVSLVEDSSALFDCSFIEAVRINKYYFFKYLSVIHFAATSLSGSSLIVPSTALAVEPTVALQRVERFLLAKGAGTEQSISHDYGHIFQADVGKYRMHSNLRVRELFYLLESDGELSQYSFYANIAKNIYASLE